MMSQLKYFSDKVLTELRGEVSRNLGNYEQNGFENLANEPGWDIPLDLQYDAALLASLDLTRPQNTAIVDCRNSKIVGESLAQLTPSLANEERVWARLAHVEAIAYCRARWLPKQRTTNSESLVRAHFFGSTQTGLRDDHALSRLWWNYHIAKNCAPNDISGALSLILTTADVRSNFVERIWMTSRRSIATAVLRAMRSVSWVTAEEANFREFMKATNRLGGGIVFEALSELETEEFVHGCISYARAKFAG